jgi:hypothetical protein
LITQQTRGVARIDVTDRSQIFVVTTGKRSAGAYRARRRQDCTIQLNANLDHRIRFIGIVFRQQLRPARAERALDSSQDRAILVPPSGDVEQREQDPLKTHADVIMQVAAHALAVNGSGQLRVFQFRGRGLHGICNRRLRFCEFEQGTHRKLAETLTQLCLLTPERMLRFEGLRQAVDQNE